MTTSQPVWITAFVAGRNFNGKRITIEVVDHRPAMRVNGKVVARVATRKLGETESTIEILWACPESVILEETSRAMGLKVRSFINPLKITHGKAGVPNLQSAVSEER